MSSYGNRLHLKNISTGAEATDIMWVVRKGSVIPVQLGLELTAGDLTLSTGSLYVTVGDIEITSGNLIIPTLTLDELLTVDASGNVISSGTTLADIENDYVNVTGDTMSGALTLQSDLNVAEYIYHDGDLDTYMRFQTNQWNLNAGGTDAIEVNSNDTIIKTNEFYVNNNKFVVNYQNNGLANAEFIDYDVINSVGDRENFIRVNNSSDTVVFGSYSGGQVNSMAFNYNRSVNEVTWNTTRYLFNNGRFDVDMRWYKQSSEAETNAYFYNAGNDRHGWGCSPNTEFHFSHDDANILQFRIESTNAVDQEVALQLWNTSQRWEVRQNSSLDFQIRNDTLGRNIISITETADYELIEANDTQIKFNDAYHDVDFIFRKLTSGNWLKYEAGTDDIDIDATTALFTIPADGFTLSASPTGGTPLAVATVDYVDTEVATGVANVTANTDTSITETIALTAQITTVRQTVAGIDTSFSGQAVGTVVAVTNNSGGTTNINETINGTLGFTLYDDESLTMFWNGTDWSAGI